MSIPPDFTRRVLENPQIAVELYEALQRISRIENRDYGCDWEEIAEARNIAIAALQAAKANHVQAHAHYTKELALDAAARTGETPIDEHVRCVPGME